MFNVIKKMFFGSANNDEIGNINYKKASQLGKETVYEEIPKIEIPTNDKKNILILDDNEQAGKLTLLDIKMLDSISKKIKTSGLIDLSEKQRLFVEQLPNRYLEKLTEINLDDYNIILATGIMGAFSIYEAIDNGLKIDYAVLDILIGGQNIYNGKQMILDGIDVANKILESNENVVYYFYSGCSLADDSDETIKFNNVVGGDIRKHLIVKDKNLDSKRQVLISLFL